MSQSIILSDLITKEITNLKYKDYILLANYIRISIHSFIHHLMANYHFTDSTKTPAYYEKKYCSKPLRYDNKHEKKVLPLMVLTFQPDTDITKYIIKF